MRRAAIILPLLLLLLLVLGSQLRFGPPPQPGFASAPPAAATTAAPQPHRALRWVGHDWIEPEPPAPPANAEARRATFGLDAKVDAAACFDPNCRACLIDLVYGREF